MLSELLRNVLCSLPPDVEAFGGLTPFGVVLRYEDVIDDPSPVVDAVWCEALVTRTIDWTFQQRSEKHAQ